MDKAASGREKGSSEAEAVACIYRNVSYLCLEWCHMPVIPALWEVKTGRSLESRGSRPAWATWWNPISTKKNTKISQVWWWVPVSLNIQKAEVGGLLESRKSRLQWAIIMPLHFSLGNKPDPASKKKEKERKEKRRGGEGRGEEGRYLKNNITYHMGKMD